MALGRYGNCGPWPSSSIPWKGPGTNLGSPSPPTSPHLISLRSTQSAKYWYFEGSELRLLKGSKHVLSWGCSPEIGLSRELTLMSRNANRLELLPLEVLEFLEIGQSGDRPDVRISTAVWQTADASVIPLSFCPTHLSIPEICFIEFFPFMVG